MLLQGGPYLEHHAGQEVVQHADGVLALVVGGDGDVHVGQGGVSVAEGDGGDVHVAGLLDGLVVRARVRQHQQPGLLEHLLYLVGECACAPQRVASGCLCAGLCMWSRSLLPISSLLGQPGV